MQVFNTRLCFKNPSYSVSNPKKISLECLPNFSISDAQLLTNPLPQIPANPSSLETESSSLHFSRNQDLTSQTIAEAQLHSRMSMKCAQFIVCTYDTLLHKYHCSASTCVFVKRGSALIGCTVLHVFKSQTRTQKIQFCLVNTTTLDLLGSIDRSVKKWHKTGGSKLIQKQLRSFLKRNPEIFLIQSESSSILEDEWGLSFLKMRKTYLDTLVDVRQLFVPGCHLHALPSIDFFPFRLPQKLQELIRREEHYFNLDNQRQHNAIQNTRKTNEELILFLPSYQNNSEDFTLHQEHSNEEYCKVLRALVKQSSKSKDKKMDSYTQRFSTKLFVNKDKSLSVCVYKSHNSNLIVFQGSTLTGSSGGPLYDSNGVLWGLNFGYITDITKPDTGHFSRNEILYEYDININQYEDSSKFQEAKNFNVAISIYSPVIQLWLQRFD